MCISSNMFFSWIISLTRKIFQFLFVLAFFFLVGCGSDEPDPPSESQLKSGANIYELQCKSCHGADGEGVGSYPALTPDRCDTCDDRSALADLISRTMPLGGNLCKGECSIDVAAYIAETFEAGQQLSSCEASSAPIRRLNRFEYSNTIEDLLGENTRLGNLLPSEEIGNGFGNDARSMSTSNLLAEQYGKVAEQAAQNTVNSVNRWRSLHSCVASVSSSTESACAKQIIERFLARAFRRPSSSEETSAFEGLYQDMRGSVDFKGSIAAVITAVLQSPEFLYRAEIGKTDGHQLKPTAYELASRLSYFLWGSMPDDDLFEAARSGRLGTPQSVRAEAERMLNDQKSRRMMEYFFDSLLPISSLRDLERDSDKFPSFNAEIGTLMREEVHTLIQHVIFEGEGDWPSVLTSPFSFVNQTLADFYGYSNVFGDRFQKVDLDTSKRKGILTTAGVMAGTIHSGTTNPVTRGAYLMKHMLCVDIPLPTGDVADLVFPPAPNENATARERFTQHSSDPVCRNCHNLMDPIGFVFEQFDPVGLFRTRENGRLINTEGELPGSGIFVANAVEMVAAIAKDERTHQCFAYNWANFAYGKTIGGDEACVKEEIQQKFVDADYDVKTLLLDLTQTNAFLFLPEDHLQ